MTQRINAVIGLWAALVSSACGTSAHHHDGDDDHHANAGQQLSGPAAIVNGVVIDASELRDRRDVLFARIKLKPVELARVEHKILEGLIDTELIHQAAQKQSIHVSSADVDGYIESDKPATTDALVRARTKQRLELERLLDKRGAVQVSEAEARKFYDDYLHQFTVDAGVRASHILVKIPQAASQEVEDQAMARINAAQAEIAQGVSFGAVAKKVSEGPSAINGGDLGFFGPGRMVEAFEDVAFGMTKGTVSKPVRTWFGLHLIYVTDVREARTTPFADAREQIVTNLRAKKLVSARAELLIELKRDATIKRFIAEPPPTRQRRNGGHSHGPGSGAHE